MNSKLCFLLSTLFVTAIVSCKSHTTQDKLVGTWIPVSSEAVNGTDIRVKFLANKIGVAERKGRKTEANDSITYEIKNDGKLLVTTEHAGKVEELEIIKLDDKELQLHSKNAGDTFKLVRER